MHELGILIRAKVITLKAILLDTRRSYLIRNISTAIVLAVLMYGSFKFFHDWIFSYVIRLEEIGFLLIERLVSVGFLAFFFMLIISSFITAISTLFRSTETEYLFSTPMSALVLFSSKFVDIIIYSSWAILLMAIPILYSYAKVHSFGALEFAMTGVFILLPYILLATSLGTLFALLTLHISRKMNFRTLLIVCTAAFIFLMYLLIHFVKPNQLVINFIEGNDDLLFFTPLTNAVI